MTHTVNCHGTESWEILGAELRYDEEPNFWKKAVLLKKIILLKNKLNKQCLKKQRLEAYKEGFPKDHPLQKEFRSALSLL